MVNLDLFSRSQKSNFVVDFFQTLQHDCNNYLDPHFEVTDVKTVIKHWLFDGWCHFLKVFCSDFIQILQHDSRGCYAEKNERCWPWRSFFRSRRSKQKSNIDVFKVFLPLSLSLLFVFHLNLTRLLLGAIHSPK